MRPISTSSPIFLKLNNLFLKNEYMLAISETKNLASCWSKGLQSK
mgnify:CR=1 FL=1